ncbi:MAG: phage portal protein [Blastococcus sp.]
MSTLGVDGALQVSTVWACVTHLANAVSTMPLETFRRTNGTPSRVTDPPLVTTPSGDMTQSEWLHMLMVSLLLYGNAFGKIVSRDRFGLPQQIELMNPNGMRVTVNDQGALEYHDQRGKLMPNVWHVRGLTLPGTYVGLSPISYAAAAIGVDLGARRFAAEFFDRGGVPKAIIKTQQSMTQEQSRTLKQRIMEGTRNREPLVLADGVDYTQISVSPDESQFLATMQANVATIARYFNVPPEMVGGSSGDSLTYANVEQRQLDFYQRGVAPWLKRLEDAFFPLLPSPQFVRFNAAALLRTDAKTQAEVDNIQLAGKTRVPSEIRARDGLPPFTPAQQAEADMVPLAITPSGQPKATDGLKLPPGPAAPVPADDSQQNSLPQVVVNNFQSQPEVRLEQPITVNPPSVQQDIHVAAAEVRQQINVAPAAAPEVRLTQPITVSPAEVKMVTVASTEPAVRSRRIERNSDGEIVRLVEE